MADPLFLIPDQKRQQKPNCNNKFVAICDGEVIAVAESLIDAYEKASIIANGRKITLKFIPAGVTFPGDS